MCMHVRTLNTNWKYCQVEVQNVFIRAETMILWKCSEMSRNKKFNRISLYLARNSNNKLKFSITQRINHSREISRVLIMHNIIIGIIIKCCWSIWWYNQCLLSRPTTNIIQQKWYKSVLTSICINQSTVSMNFNHSFVPYKKLIPRIQTFLITVYFIIYCVFTFDELNILLCHFNVNFVLRSVVE